MMRFFFFNMNNNVTQTFYYYVLTIDQRKKIKSSISHIKMKFRLHCCGEACYVISSLTLYWWNSFFSHLFFLQSQQRDKINDKWVQKYTSYSDLIDILK